MLHRNRLQYWIAGIVFIVIIAGLVRYDLSLDSGEYYMRGKDTMAAWDDNKYQILRSWSGEEHYYTLDYKGTDTIIDRSNAIVAYKAIDDFLYLITQKGWAVVDMKHNECYLFDNIEEISDQYQCGFSDSESFTYLHR